MTLLVLVPILMGVSWATAQLFYPDMAWGMVFSGWVAVGLSVVEMLALRASNVGADGGAVGAVNDLLPVPPALRPFLCARLATVDRLGLGADPCSSPTGPHR